MVLWSEWIGTEIKNRTGDKNRSFRVVLLESMDGLYPYQYARVGLLVLEEISPLQTTLIERGIVSSRVALLLRSAEIKPILL